MLPQGWSFVEWMLCGALSSGDAFFSWTTSTTNRLCSIDTIRVIDSIGGSIRPGVACGLGEFHPVSADTLEQLKVVDEKSQ